MPHYLPDAESITEYCGAYEARGCRFDIVSAAQMGGFGLRMHIGTNSTAAPIFPLPAAEMQTPEAAEQWMAYLRDNRLSQFAFLLQG